MDWDNKDRAVLPSMEFPEDANEGTVQLINRMTDLEVIVAQIQNEINYIKTKLNI